jgi:uncharacterized membrane protein required for colicin V production
MFSWVDIVVIIIVLISTFMGYKRGFFKTLYGLLAFFVAIFLAFSFYKPLSTYLKNNTNIDEWIIANMQIKTSPDGEETETPKQQESKPKEVEQENITIKDMPELEKTLENLPENIKEMLGFEDIKNQALENIRIKIADLAINLISILGIYVVTRLILAIVCAIVDSVLQLPILKQINELLGLFIGTILGFMQVYLVFALITFLSSIINMSFLVENIKNSTIARILYENNIIIGLLF